MSGAGGSRRAKTTLSLVRCETADVLGIGQYVPFLLIVAPLEGQVRVSIRGCRSTSDWHAMQAAIARDEGLDELCELAQQLRDRKAA
jgi:hypothetical protein